MKIHIAAPKIKDILEYMLMIIIIFGTYTMIERDIAYDVSETVLSLIFSCLCFILFVINNYDGVKKYSGNDILKIAALSIISICIIFIPFYRVTNGTLKWIIPVICCSLFAISMRNPKEIWKKYVNVVVVLAIVSLIFYIFGSVLNILSPTRTATFLYEQNYHNCNTYFGIQYEAQKLFGYGSFLSQYRNTGIFIEAPMFNLVLCIALGAELAFQSSPRKFVVGVLTVTILSTFATTGVMFIVIVFVIRLFFIGDKNIFNSFKALVFPFAVFLGIFIFIALINSKTQTTVGEVSFSVRWDHLIACLKMWVSKPLFGYGYVNTKALYEFTQYDQGISVGLPALLGRNGCLIFLIYLVPFINRVICSIKNDPRQLYFWIGTFFLFFMTAAVYRTIFIFLLCTQLLWQDREIVPESVEISEVIYYKSSDKTYEKSTI